MKTLEQLGFKRIKLSDSTHFDVDNNWISFFNDGSLAMSLNSAPSEELFNAIRLELKKPKLTEEVKQLIRLLPLEVKWVACDNGGGMFGYKEKPTKYIGAWAVDNGTCYSLNLFKRLLSPLITWNDTEPINLDEWRALL